MRNEQGTDDSRAGVFLLLFGWLAATAWIRVLALPDEGRYVGVAWEMLRSGEWLTPQLNGLPYFHKPPLFYWITAASLWAGGLHEWSARVAPLLGAMAATLSLFHFVRRWSGAGAARASVLVLATQPLFFLGAQFANLDMLVAGCITVTILLAADAALRIIAGQPHRRVLAVAYLAAALGVLAKGLIGAAIPAIVILVWLAAMHRWKVMGRLVWLPGLALFLAVTAPWFIAMQVRFPSFFDYFFIVQQFTRYTRTGFNNPQPFWFYPVVLSVLVLPWSPWLYRAMSRTYWRDALALPVRMLMWSWLFVVVLFFSFPQSKLVGYVLPALAPLAFLIADTARPLLHRSGQARRLWVSSAVVAVVASLGLIAGTMAKSQNSKRDLAQTMAALRQPGEPIFFLHEYFYEVPFYARLTEPVLVVGDWQGPASDQADNWKKELVDAGRFAGNGTLVDDKQLVKTLCSAPVNWIMTSANVAARYAFLAEVKPVISVQQTQLLRIDRASLHGNKRWCG
ncbi:MAG: glycosyltransferase family 39 protein [Ramlibacter sp.]|nr:glycosyltransferase family 39 protein [Ramlibacter sp.]